MLNQPLDIYQVPAPFLILFGDRSWRVASRLFPCQDGVGFIEPFAEQASEDAPSGIVPGTPFHVGHEVWELDYNAQIMTLNHPHHHRHPAWQLWLSWLSSQQATGGGRAH